MFNALRLERCRPIIRVLNEFSTTARTCNDANDDGDKKNSRQIAAAKLQELLSKLATESAKEKNTVEAKSRLKMSQPVKKIVEQRPIYKVKMEKIADKHTAQLVSAVKEVADHVGGRDVKGTEAELLHVILNNKRPEGKIDGDVKLESVISGMLVEKSEDTRAAQVRRSLPSDRRQRTDPRWDHRSESSLDLFAQKPLGIFPTDFRGDEASVFLPTWSKMAEKELKLLVTHPPSNIYEEMIRWTERRQLWTFPIDNEQGLEKEKAVDFTQHVFLDEHLESWCPTKGPIRQFMELVLIGLSKNPYITIEAKIDHINWFRDYFDSKKKLLQEVGALPAAEDGKKISA